MTGKATVSLWLERQRRHLRAAASGRNLRPVADRTARIGRNDILLVATVRNERTRLPFFLDYYRRLGIGHALIVDNGSDDGSGDWLAAQPDVSLWSTASSYRDAGYGIDWLNHLLHRHAPGHWVLVADADEFFVYPHMDTRPLRALTDWLTASRRRAFGAMLIDMYSDGPIARNDCPESADPFQVLTHFDSASYIYERNGFYRNLWIRGGPRQRVFFRDRPEAAPALNKIPLVRWNRRCAYVSSTHMLLPRRMNEVYDETGGELTSGALLHAKFLSDFVRKARLEADRAEHFDGGREYRVYRDQLDRGIGLWTPHSTRYEGWRQLEALGLISTGDWA